MLEALAAELGR
jgi:hypothetical protein